MAADADLFINLDSKDFDRVDLIDFVEDDLRTVPSPQASPHPQFTPRCPTRPSSPTTDAAFDIMGDQDSVISQITLINGEKIWVREERTGSAEDCNSSSDSINISVPLFVHRIDDKLLSYSSTCSEMMDLQTLLQPESSCLSSPPAVPTTTTVRLVSKPSNLLVRDKSQPKVLHEDFKLSNGLQNSKYSIPKSMDTDGSTSLLRSALMRNTNSNSESVESFPFNNNNSSVVVEANNNNNENAAESMFRTESMEQGDDLSSDAIIEEILLLAKKQASEPVQVTLSETPNSMVPVATSVAGDDNNNIKKTILTSVGQPTGVISLVVDNRFQRQDRIDSRRKYIRRSKGSTSSGSQSSSATSPPPIQAACSVTAAEEPRKESRLLHYCHMCNKGFKDRYSVNVHVRTHTGEKPFKCSLCGKCFRQKAHLAKHHQTHVAKGGPNGPPTIQIQGNVSITPESNIISLNFPTQQVTSL